MCFLSWVFHRRTSAAFLPAVSGIVGKGLEREMMRPFLCLRRFGAHSETPFSSPFFRRTSAAFLLAVSGMVMWLNTGLLPDGSWKVEFSPTTVLVAHLVHDVFFFLTVFVGIAHIYLGAGIFQPYRGTARIMFGDGKVSESDAAYHWGYWANEEIALGKNVTTVNDEKDKKSA